MRQAKAEEDFLRGGGVVQVCRGDHGHQRQAPGVQRRKAATVDSTVIEDQDVEYEVVLRFRPDGPAVLGVWCNPETADTKFTEWLGSHDRDEAVLIPYRHRRRRNAPGKELDSQGRPASSRDGLTRVRAGPPRLTTAKRSFIGRDQRRCMEHDTAAEPVTGTYPDEPRLALLTHAEAREAIELFQLLEQLAPGGRGPAAGQLAADLARCLPTPKLAPLRYAGAPMSDRVLGTPPPAISRVVRSHLTR